MTHLDAWATHTARRRVVLEVVASPEGLWRAEAIDEHGSTAGLTIADDPVRCLVLLEEGMAGERPGDVPAGWAGPVRR